ncbi:MAG: sigma-70 family RNA polymerase sigma factor [Archangiaceae bacterium]|mgnify:CR=1 FL=1|nr:sigma-70 family RNA polymerase sigma factor [Archangiaceae bacterium]
MPAQPLDLTTLYEAHARQVWRTLARLGVPAANVEDAVHDVFLTAHQRLSEFGQRSSPSTWLIGIAVKAAANLRRKSKRQGLVVAAPASTHGPDDELERRRKLFELERVLSRLPDEQREVVVLCDLEQLSAPEVAEVLEEKLNTIYSRLRLGRAALKRALSTEESS